MDRDSSKCLSLVLKHEGGFVNQQAELGRETNAGVTLANFRRRVKQSGGVAALKNLAID